ncbi:hypothetical protein [Gordonia sputi]
MRTPSWVELAGRNAAAESVNVVGMMAVDEPLSGSVRFDFRHAQGGRWRIEHEGQPIYLSSGSSSVVRVDGEMQRLDGDFRLPIMGAQFSPLDLLGPSSLLHRMSTTVSVEGAAHHVEVGGRAAWSITLLGSGGHDIIMTFDDATGVLVRLEDAAGVTRLQVSDLNELGSFSESLFVWDGRVHAARPGRGRTRSTEDDEDQRIEFMRSRVAAQTRAQDVLSVITAADSEAEARAALMQLLDVTEFGAESIIATPIGQFRGDFTASDRHTLEAMEQQYRSR